MTKNRFSEFYEPLHVPRFEESSLQRALLMQTAFRTAPDAEMMVVGRAGATGESTCWSEGDFVSRAPKAG